MGAKMRKSEHFGNVTVFFAIGYDGKRTPKAPEVRFS